MAVLLPGGPIVEGTFSGGSITIVDGLLLDNNENYLVDIHGFFINIGGGFGGASGPSSSTYGGGSLGTATIIGGNHIPVVPFVPGT